MYVRAGRIEQRILRAVFERMLDPSLQVPRTAARWYVFIDLSFIRASPS